ncbi:hypothetical protein ACIQYF_05590 [Pseudomonas sp. NPDC096917]|uniref:hypothetical protein n=1 Tax=Pseudomonas sp. NPDC096917 TaxID=3364483 RepID=UPI00383B69D0
MSFQWCFSGWRRVFCITVFACLAFLSLRWVMQVLSDEPEIALIYDEPWEDMRQRSSAVIDPAIPGQIWFHIPDSDARLRFIDPKYGFTTPLARFFTINFVDERVRDIRMSPQIEPLLLDDALKVVLDLQDQWRQQGWHLTSRRNNYAFEDTPEWRTQFRDINKGGTAFWQAEDKYQVMLLLHRFKDNKRPNEERYLITLALSRPWVPSHED